MKTQPHPRFDDFLYRPDAYDDYIIREQGSYARLGIGEGDVVMDVGAQIGAFARWAIEHGATSVAAYEPEPENVALLKHNVKGHRVAVFEVAIVGVDDPQVDLFVNDKKNKGLHSTEFKRGRDAIRVPAIRFSSELSALEPDVLKVDIEGGEYELDWERALELHQPRAIGLELHLTRKEWREREAKRLISLIKRAGYKTPRVSIPEKSWTMLTFFERKA